MINISSILKQNVLGKLFNHVIVFLINVFIVRNLGAAESGYYFNELYLISFIVFLFSAGLDYAAIAWISREPRLLPLVHRKLLQATIFFTLLWAILLTLGKPLLLHFFKQPVIAVAMFATGNLLLIFYQGILSAQKKFNLQNVLLSVTNILFLLYLLIFIKKGDDPFQYIGIGYSILLLIQGTLMYTVSYQRGDLQSFKVNWTPFYMHGIRIMFSSLIYFAFLRVDNFFVEQYSDPVTLSNYVQCGKIGQYFLYFSSIISSTLLPFIGSREIGHSYSEWKKLMRPYILLIVLGAFLIGFAGQFVYPWLFGPAFTDMQQYMLIFLPGFVCLGILTLVNAVYIGKGNIRKIFTGDLLGFLTVAALDGLLVPTYGATAAAIVSSATYALVFLYLWKDLKKQFIAA